MSIIFDNVGTLTISFIQRSNTENNIQKLLSSFKFQITLQHTIFKQHNSLTNVFFILYNVINNIKRPLYKSQEFNNTTVITSNVIRIRNELFYNGQTQMYNNIIFGLFCPNICNGVPYTEASINIYQLENNIKNDILTDIYLMNSNNERIGKIQINYNQSEKKTFLDYLSIGMQLNLDIAIDYTASNKTDKYNLHEIKGTNQKNDYEKAIESCGSIIGFYDYDQIFPVYGFGGVPLSADNPGQYVQHCFNVNFQKDPNINGIGNILNAYRDSIGKVKLASPTYFTPVIKQVIGEIKYDLIHRQSENHYYVILILTDGNINDMNSTKDIIVEASSLPLSIIIVGIGPGDFSLMDQLDGDKIPLENTKGEVWKRDIVQFVEFEKFKKGNEIEDVTSLTEEVLKEIPTQVEEYFEKCGKFYSK
jgi:hypothetical protein